MVVYGHADSDLEFLLRRSISMLEKRKQGGQPKPLIVGQRFHRLIVLRTGTPKDNGNCMVSTSVCLCDCGNIIETINSAVRSGNTKSCGVCVKTENIKHGAARGHGHTLEYASWSAMLTRCYNETCSVYGLYGGRGIKACKRWRYSFENFLSDMGPRTSSKYTLERLDTNGNYTPANCIWATRLQQSRNRRNNHYLTLNGTTQCISAWAEQLGMSKIVISGRLQRGWSAERALTEPVKRKGEQGD